jgi:hypothetical protein
VPLSRRLRLDVVSQRIRSGLVELFRRRVSFDELSESRRTHLVESLQGELRVDVTAVDELVEGLHERTAESAGVVSRMSDEDEGEEGDNEGRSGRGY